jgi:hypothetical protein
MKLLTTLSTETFVAVKRFVKRFMPVILLHSILDKKRSNKYYSLAVKNRTKELTMRTFFLAIVGLAILTSPVPATYRNRLACARVILRSMLSLPLLGLLPL